MSEIDTLMNDSIWAQLQESPVIVKPSRDEPPLTMDNAEAFILKNAQTLINNSIESMESIKELVCSAPGDAEVAESLAKLIEATSGAIDTVNKILLADKRNATMIKSKQMDIDSRKEPFETAVGARLMLTREELIQKLALNSTAANNLKTIDAKVISEPLELKDSN